MMAFLDIPRTVKEAIDQILSGWSKEETMSFQSLPVNSLFDLRNTLGADIRNTFSLWYGNDELLRDCENFLTQYQEFYDQALLVIEENEQGKKKVADVDELPLQIPSLGYNDINDDMEEEEEEEEEEIEDFLIPPVEESLKINKIDSSTPIDPFIASQVIIFATWNHLQGHGPIL
jgi:hypothetical protein